MLEPDPDRAAIQHLIVERSGAKSLLMIPPGRVSNALLLCLLELKHWGGDARARRADEQIGARQGGARGLRAALFAPNARRRRR